MNKEKEKMFRTIHTRMQNDGKQRGALDYKEAEELAMFALGMLDMCRILKIISFDEWNSEWHGIACYYVSLVQG